MTTLALTIPETAPATQDVALGEIVCRGLKFALMLTGAALTIYILSELGPVVYGLPMPLLRRALAPDAAAI